MFGQPGNLRSATALVQSSVSLIVCNLLVVVTFFYRRFRTDKEEDLRAPAVVTPRAEESGCELAFSDGKRGSNPDVALAHMHLKSLHLTGLTSGGDDVSWLPTLSIPSQLPPAATMGSVAEEQPSAFPPGFLDSDDDGDDSGTESNDCDGSIVDVMRTRRL